ncbi:unnamed protein product [Gordionus sp. m RMFG-2023]|uniref:ras suppressor protein 1-like n=1 Tax=Gordionus sp. m RMFG-2023 TaxID=3053472 RepID=UPI0030E371C9
MTKFRKYVEECIDKNIDELDIVDKGLVNIYDLPGLFSLKQLTRLTISHNKIESIPPGIAELENLEILNCFNNQIEEIPTTISTLPKLRILNLAFNRLSNLPRGFGSCATLEILDLTYNNLTDKSLPSNFYMLSTLRALYLGDNDFEIISPEIGKLKNLQILNLRENDLILVPKELNQLTKLKELNISGNRLSVLPPELSEIESLANKQMLKMDNNPWLPPISDQLRLGVNHVINYIKTQTYKFLYNRHLSTMETDNSIIPIKDKSKKLSRLKK